MPSTLPFVATLAATGNKPATFWMPEQASTVAPGVDLLFNGINALCYFFFAIITVVLVWCVVKYRRSPDNHAGNSRGPTHNTVLELTWTVIPLILVVILFWLGFRGFVELTVAPKNSYEIQVTAQKWAWSFKYPTGASSNDLVVPAARPVRLVMRSNDVLHSLFIPDFRVKQDVVPGRYTSLWFEAPVPTHWSYEAMDPKEAHHLFCAEYCGEGHSNMNRRVYVLEQPLFEEWLDKAGRWLDDVPAEDLWAVAGPQFYARCAQCHTLGGVDGNGPSWGPRAAAGVGGLWERTLDMKTKFTDGRTLADLIGPGKEYATPEDYLRDSILNPHRHLVQGFGTAMPTFKGQLSEKALDAVIGMMKHADQFEPDGKPKPGSDAAKTVEKFEEAKKKKSEAAAKPATS